MKSRKRHVVPLALATCVASTATAFTATASAETTGASSVDYSPGRSVTAGTAERSLLVDSKGGYKACPAGKKIRVRVDYRMNPKGDRVRVRIYESPSRSSRRDVQRDMYPTDEYTNTVFVQGRIRVGYWNVRSTPGARIVDQYTRASCV